MKNLQAASAFRIRFSSKSSSPKTFDAAKLEEDKERIRDAYQKQGYFTAKALDQTLKLRDVGGAQRRLPHSAHQGKQAGQGRKTSRIPVEEGQRYYLAKIDFDGREAVPLHRISRPAFPDAAGRRLLHRKAAQRPEESDQGLQPVRLHRLRRRAADRHRSQLQQDRSDAERR